MTLRWARASPIGGLKEKLLAAARGGIKKGADPEGEREGSRGRAGQHQGPGWRSSPYRWMEQVLEHALVRMPESITWDEATQAEKVRPLVDDDIRAWLRTELA